MLKEYTLDSDQYEESKSHRRVSLKAAMEDILQIKHVAVLAP